MFKRAIILTAILGSQPSPAFAADSDPNLKKVTITDTMTGDPDPVTYPKTPSTGASYSLSIENGSTATSPSMSTKIVLADSKDTTKWGATQTWKEPDVTQTYTIAVNETDPLAVTFRATLYKVSAGSGSGNGKERPGVTKNIVVPYEATLNFLCDQPSADAAATKTRLKIGVGEHVAISVEGSHLGAPTWSLVNNSNESKLTDDKLDLISSDTKKMDAVFLAGKTPGKVTIQLSFTKSGKIITNIPSVDGTLTSAASRTHKFVFDVIAPNGETVYINPSEGGTYPIGQCQAGGLVQFKVLPEDVSFHYVGFSESDEGDYANPKGITGFFNDLQIAIPGFNLKHDAFSDSTKWGTVDGQNYWTTRDKITSPRINPTGSGMPSLSDGQFKWEIPCHYRAFKTRTEAETSDAAAQIGDALNSFKFNQRTQLHKIKSSGRMYELKASKSNPTDPSPGIVGFTRLPSENTSRATTSAENLTEYNP